MRIFDHPRSRQTLSHSLECGPVFQPDCTTHASLAFYSVAVQAGFPSPADDHCQERLDLNQHLIQRPAATYFVRTVGNSMNGAGIYEGDILVVDRSLHPRDGDIVIAAVNGELTVKRLHLRNNRLWLTAENPAYPTLEILESMEFVIWGVVTAAVHQYRKG